MRIELLNGEDLSKRLQIMATAGMLSRSDKNVFDLFVSRDDKYEKNLKVVNNIIAMGHETIIEHDYLVFGLQDVSPIIEQIIIGLRLASFTIKSRREVDFSSVGYYNPDFSYLENGNQINDMYNNHMQYLFDGYSKIVDTGVKKEDARFVLPYSYHSNIIMGVDGRTLEKLIKYCLTSQMSIMPEVREFGEKLKAIALEKAPYLADKLEGLEYSFKDETSFLDRFMPREESILEKPELISVHSDFYPGEVDNEVDATIIISHIMYRNNLPFEEALLTYSQLTNDEKKMIIKKICTSSEQRELEHVSFKYQIPMSWAILTHLTRHRMHSLIVPEFLPVRGLDKHIVPNSIKAKCLDLYEEIFAKNYDKYLELKEAGVEDKDLAYFYLSGNMVNVTTNINGRALEWISRMRCCNKAQWSIRDTVNSMVAQAKEHTNLYGEYLGATCDVFGTCPEGKECCGKVYALKKENI